MASNNKTMAVKSNGPRIKKQIEYLGLEKSRTAAGLDGPCLGVEEATRAGLLADSHEETWMEDNDEEKDYARTRAQQRRAEQS